MEETGYENPDWTYRGQTLESTSKLTNRMHLYLAKKCIKVSSQQLDEKEHLSVMKVKLNDAVDMVMDGTINANSTAHLILKVLWMIGERNGL